MAFLGKLVVLVLLACATALPKIQHRADSGNNGYDFSQYFNSEKFQQYLKENPSALNSYFNIPSQSSSSNTDAAAVQSDSMLEDSQSQQGFSQFTNYQQYMEKCMGQSYSSFGSSNSQSSQSSGSKAEGKANPWDQYLSQSPYKPPSSSSFSDYQKQWEKCQQQIQQAGQSYNSQISNYQGSQ